MNLESPINPESPINKESPINTEQGEEKRAVVLFGHGARDPEWAGPMQRMRAQMLERSPELRVELAFLEFMSPNLAEAIEQLVAQGFARVQVVPVFLAQGGHLRRDVPEAVRQAAARHPGCQIALSLAAGEAPGVIAAIARYALDEAGRAPLPPPPSA